MIHEIDSYLAARVLAQNEAWPRPWRQTDSPGRGLYDADGESIAHGSATGDLEAADENVVAIVDAVNEAPRMLAALRDVLALCDQWDRDAVRAGVSSDGAAGVRTVIHRALLAPYMGGERG